MQALHYLASCSSVNPKCYLAQKNRALLHMGQAESQEAAEMRALVPAQHEMALNFHTRAMDQDWHLPHGFFAGQVFLRLETRVTADPYSTVNPPASLKNEVYHFGTNLTHVHSRLI